jgi:hypothetical protein
MITRGMRGRARFPHRALGALAMILPTVAAAVAAPSPAAAAPPDDGMVRELDNLRRAVDHLKVNPAGSGRRFSAALLQKAEGALKAGSMATFAGSDGPVVTVGGQRIALQPDDVRLSELGASLRAREDRQNLERLYRMVFARLRPGARAALPPPDTFAQKDLAAMQVDIGQLAVAASADLPGWHPILINLPPSAATCQAELGYENGTDATASTCASYATNGIMRNIAFPLRDDLTCMRNQGRRGTCVAFGATAAMETGVHVLNGNKVNLSEQHAYWYGETTVGFSGRYTYGLNTADYLAAVASDGYQVPKEKIWNYNPSTSMQALSGNVYPDSCVGYTGEECSDYAFQSVEVPWFGGTFLYPNPMPNAGAFAIDAAVALGTDAVGLNLAKSLLDWEVPLVVAIDVTANFLAPNADGYVTYAPGEASVGGHALHIAGWVPNAELPAGAPAGSGGGYFVAKNSWGGGPGDCGYYYVPADFIEEYGRSLTSVTVQ